MRLVNGNQISEQLSLQVQPLVCATWQTTWFKALVGDAINRV